MAHLGSRSGNTGGGVGQFNVTKPTESIEGSWLFCLINSNVLASLGSLVATDSSWELVGSLQSGFASSTVSTMHLFQKRVSAFEAGTSGPSFYTFDIVGTNRTAAWSVVCYDELPAANPVVAYAALSSADVLDSSIAVPIVTSTKANQRVIRCGTMRANASFTPINGYSEWVDYNPGLVNYSLFWHDILRAAAGQTTATNVQASVGGEHVGVSLVLDNNIQQTALSTLLPDGVPFQSGYVNATTSNIANVRGDPDVSGGVGFSAQSMQANHIFKDAEFRFRVFSNTASIGRQHTFAWRALEKRIQETEFRWRTLAAGGESGVGRFPGIRWYPMMGTYAGADQGWIHDPGVVDEQYAIYVGPTRENAYLNLGATPRYYFGGGRKITWRDALVNESVAPPDRATAQNPDWSGYKWNQPGNDVITEQLESSSRIAEGKAKLCVFVATTATSVKNPVPTWMLNTPNMTWTDAQGKDHVRMDVTAAWQAAADFLVALGRKYGEDPRVASITHGEYYTNPDASVPPVDYDVFRSNMKLVWAHVINNLPRDGNGNRVNFVQSQPITAGGFVTAQDLINIGVGISGSGAYLFTGSPIDSIRPLVYGKIPTQHQVNTGSLGDPATWQVPPANPFGIANGVTLPMEYQHVAWYFSSGGPSTLDSLMMRDDSKYVADWHTAYGKFGPNGTLRATWGGIPNVPPV